MGAPADTGRRWWKSACWRLRAARIPYNTYLPDIGLRGPALTPDEVYALTAYILFLNNVVQEDDVLDRQTLPRVRMPLLSDQLERAMAVPR